MMISDRPEATASSTTYWIIGLSTSGSISFGCAFVAGRNLVPRPAAGKTPLRTFTRSSYRIPRVRRPLKRPSAPGSSTSVLTHVRVDDLPPRPLRSQDQLDELAHGAVS